MVWHYLVYALVLVSFGLGVPDEDNKAWFAHCCIDII